MKYELGTYRYMGCGDNFQLPPPNEQKRIVAKVDQFMILCNELE